MKSNIEEIKSITPQSNQARYHRCLVKKKNIYIHFFSEGVYFQSEKIKTCLSAWIKCIRI